MPNENQDNAAIPPEPPAAWDNAGVPYPGPKGQVPQNYAGEIMWHEAKPNMNPDWVNAEPGVNWKWVVPQKANKSADLYKHLDIKKAIMDYEGFAKAAPYPWDVALYNANPIKQLVKNPEFKGWREIGLYTEMKKGDVAIMVNPVPDKLAYLRQYSNPEEGLKIPIEFQDRLGADALRTDPALPYISIYRRTFIRVGGGNAHYSEPLPLP